MSGIVNGGTTWTAETSGTTQTRSALGCPGSGWCYATGSAGTIISTYNGGTTWDPQPVLGNFNLLGVSCALPTTCEVVGQSGTVIGITADNSSWAVRT